MMGGGGGGGGRGAVILSLKNGISSPTRYSLDYEHLKSRGEKREKQELKN